MIVRRFGWAMPVARGLYASMVVSMVSLSVPVLGAQLAPAASPSDAAATVGLVTYSVPADRVSTFEELLMRCVRILKAGDAPERPRAAPGLRVYRAAPTTPAETLFVVLAEPAAAGTSYSIERLLEAAGGADAEAALADWRRFFGSTAPFATTMRLLDSVTPGDALRARLEAELGPVVGQSSGAPVDTARDREQLDRLTQPNWAVDQVQYEAIERTPSAWRFRWLATVRSASLVQGLSGTLSVELRDAAGTVLVTGRPVDVQLDRLEQRTFSGELSVTSAVGARVASARAEVTIRR